MNYYHAAFVAPQPPWASMFQASHACPRSLPPFLSWKQTSGFKPGTSGLVACFSHTSYVPWERCKKYELGSSHPASYASKHAGVHMHACADTHMHGDPQ